MMTPQPTRAVRIPVSLPFLETGVLILLAIASGLG